MRKWVQFILLFLLSMLAAVYMFSIVHFAFFFEEYRFGTEVAGFLYYSAWRYGGINSGLAAIGVCALFLPWMFKLKKTELVQILCLCVLVAGLFI